MYRITYIHKDSDVENPLYIAGDQDYCLVSGTLNLECGKSGELTIEIPYYSPARYSIVCPTDELIVYRNDKEIWRGRPITIDVDFYLTGKLTCEGILSYLYDTYYPAFEFEGSPKEFLQMVLKNHNEHVEERKQFALGEITVVDNNDYINRSSIYYNRSLTVLTEKLINDSLGGYFRVRIEDGVRYLDYLENYNTESSQRVEYGENILDIAENIEYTDLATAILPLGARIEDDEGGTTDEYTTIASVNGGSIYYQDDAAVAEYGWICVSVEWEDVTLPENLLKKAIAYLEQVTSAVQSFEVNAVDLSLISDEYEQIMLGDYVFVISRDHDINQYIELTAMTLNILNPENDVLKFGADTASLSDAQRNTESAIQSALSSLSMRVTNLTANVINAVYANIETIVSSMITTDVIKAAVAELGYVTIDYLEDYYASIQYLEANYATILELQAAFADVELLNADVANILNLLAGNAGVGDLQTIILTADNAIIDEAIIINALMGTVLADIIDSNVIYTDYIKIANNDSRSLWIDGSTMQFTDENGVVRVQIGLDASGNYNYYLWDADGNLIWDPMGLTEAGLTGNGAIIKDAAVADDANISAYKLNIEELTSVLNANGQLVLSAEQITIGGGTLDYALTEITEQIENLEAMEGVESVENYYILGGPDAPPWEPGDDGAASILGEMILGESILGTTHWTTEQPKASEGEYVWFSQKITYVNGDIVWTTPTLLTDDYVRNAITVQQTELEVIQGQIQAKIWLSDIETTADELTTIINDQYGILTVLIDAIDLRVGTLTTTVDYYYTELSSQVAAISLDLSSITAEVREVDEKYSNALVEGTPYYAVSTNPNWYPPYDVEGRTSVLGEMILGEAILGVSGNEWTTEQPAWKEGQYIWMTSLRERADGTTYWTEPTLLTDEWMRENATQMSERYSQIVMQVDSISEEVVNVQSELALNYSTTTEIKAIIDAAVTDTSSTILQEVSYNYASINYVDDVLHDLDLNAVVKIETYYCVSDEEPAVFFEEDFASGTGPAGWSALNTTVSGNSLAWNDDVLGNCLKLIRGNTNAPGVSYYLGAVNWGQCNISFKAATKSGQEQQTVFQVGVFGTNINSEAGQLKADEWTTFTYEFSGSTRGGSFSFYNYSDPDANTTLMIKDMIVENTKEYPWTKEQPDVGEDEKLWVSYLITFVDGHTEWTDPVCLTQDIEIDLSDYVTQAELRSNTASIEQYVDASSASIIQQVSSTYATMQYVEGALQDIDNEFITKTAYIEQYVDESYASILSEVQSVYSDLSGTITSMAASLELYVDESMAAINLSVSGGLGNTASITLTTNGGDIVQSLDLSKVREAFANDKSAVTISAGTVAFISNTLLITSKCLELDSSGNLTINTNQFTLTSSGNATFSGNLSAPSGNIGGWTIGASYLCNGPTSLTSTTSGMYVGIDGIRSNNSNYNLPYGIRISDGSIFFYYNTTLAAQLLGGSDGGLLIAGELVIQGGNKLLVGGTSYSNYVFCVSGSGYATGTFYSASDEKLKTDIRNIDNGDKIFDVLNPIEYRYKNDDEGNKIHFGLTYQNIIEALEAAGIDPNDTAIVRKTHKEGETEEFGTLAYNELIGLLVYEVKKLKTQINEMKGA